MENENNSALYREHWARICEANNGYVYYESLQSKMDNKPLYNLYEKMKKTYDSLPRITGLKDVNSIGAALKGYAKNEREKELAMIRYTFGEIEGLTDAAQSNSSMVRLMNDIFDSTTDAQRIARRIKEMQQAQTEAKAGQSVSLGLNERLGGLMIEVMNEVLREVSNGTLELPKKVIKKMADQFLDDDVGIDLAQDIGEFIVQQSFERLARRGDALMKGKQVIQPESRVLRGKGSKRAQELLDSTGDLFTILKSNNRVIQSISQRILADPIMRRIQAQDNLRGGRTTIREIVSRRNAKGRKYANFIDSTVSSYRGLTAEDIGVGIIEAAVTKANKGRKKSEQIKVQGTSTKFNAFSADTIYYFGEAAVRIDIDSLINDLSYGLNLGSNKGDAGRATQKIIEEFDNVAKFNNDFLIFETTKEYGLSQSSQFSFGGTSRDYDSALYTLNELYPAQRAYNQLFLSKLMNAMQGAIVGEDGLKEMKDDLRTLLAENFAALLFDDFSEIGKKGKVIHLFNLNNVRVPLSVLLDSAGEALLKLGANISNMAKYAQITISTPHTLTYDAAPPNSGLNFLNKWEEQREKAKHEFALSIQFYKNFQQEMLSWFG